MFLKTEMGVGSPLDNAESSSKLSKNVCSDVCAACGFFWKSISFIFLGVSIVSCNIMAGFSL